MDFFQRASICARDIQFERHTRKKGLVPGQKYDPTLHGIDPLHPRVLAFHQSPKVSTTRCASLALPPDPSTTSPSSFPTKQSSDSTRSMVFQRIGKASCPKALSEGKSYLRCGTTSRSSEDCLRIRSAAFSKTMRRQSSSFMWIAISILDENDFRAAGSSYPTGLGHRFRRVLQLRRQAAARIQSLRRSGAKDGVEFRVPGLLPIRLTSGGPDWSDGKLEDRLSMSVRGSRAG